MASLNKKNLRLKNMIISSPLSKQKVNVSNIISITTTNNQGNSINISSYINEQNKLLKNLYNSYTSNKKKKSGNSSNKKSNSVKKQIKKNLVSLGSSPLITCYSKFTSNLNSKRNSYSHNSSIKFYSKKTSSVDKSIKKRNFKELIKSNTTFSNRLFNKKSFESSEKKNKFKSILKKEITNKNKRRNIFSHRNNISSEDFSSSICNINIYYKDFFKRLKNKNDIFINKEIKSNSVKKNYTHLKSEKSIQLQTKFSTSQSTLNKKKQNSNMSNNNNDDTGNINNIENPEELHFYFVNIFQNRKNVEKKFENDI